MALVALGAVAEVVSPSGKEYIPVEKLYAGVGKSILDSSTQIVTRIQFPALLKNQGSAYERLEQRKALALPMLNVAVVVSLADNQFQWARIVMAPVGPGPVRATEAEAFLKGADVTLENIEKQQPRPGPGQSQVQRAQGFPGVPPGGAAGPGPESAGGGRRPSRGQLQTIERRQTNER